MARTIEGMLSAEGKRFGIVVSRFNEFITQKLLGGAMDCIVRHGGSDDDITVAWVPGSFEIPVALKRMALSGNYDAVICLGAVIRGATPHFEYVAGESAKGVAQVSMQADGPVSYGILTTDTIEQAIERAGTKAGNKGWDAALSAIEMITVLEQLG